MFARRLTSLTASPISSGGTSEIAGRAEQEHDRERGAQPVRPREPVERASAAASSAPTTSRWTFSSGAGRRACSRAARPSSRHFLLGDDARARAGRAPRSRGRPRSTPTRSSCVPRAATRPWSSTTISSARAIVERRWAMITVVRPRIASCRPSRIFASVVASTDAVASSRIRIARVDDERARDRDALALPAGERDPALADHRVVALGQPLDELVRLREPRGLLDLLVGRLGPAEREVLAHGRREEERILRDRADLAAQRVERQRRARRRRRS